jgi:preprotein translocase YajC subunit
MIFLDAAEGSTQSVAQNLILFAVMFLLLYFLFIRPEQTRRKNLMKMQDGLSLGQKVYAGAIVGTVKKLSDCEVEVLRAAISFVELPKEEDQQPIS